MRFSSFTMKYCAQNAETDSVLRQNTSVSPFATKLILSRGFTPEELEDFLAPPSLKNLMNPFLIDGMEDAVDRILMAVSDGEKIMICGDYDCDGITATVILYDCLKSLGADVSYFIPDREADGYGMNKKAIKRFFECGVTLIITVDNGISSIEEVDYANSLGIDTVITDHHIPKSDELPDACVIAAACISQSEECYKSFAGVGVSLMLVCALCDGNPENLPKSTFAYAAIGTIADIVPLTGQNRLIVSLGLGYIKTDTPEPLNQLFSLCSLDPATVTSTDIAFIIAPRVNAAGRMTDAGIALELFLSKSAQDARRLSEELCTQNDLRRETESAAMRKINDYINDNPQTIRKKIIVVSGAGLHHGILGIIASKLCNMFCRPCVVFSDDGELLTGSARSVSGFSIYAAISQCGVSLVRFGGHDLAAGMTIEKSNLASFADALDRYARQTHPEPFVENISIAFELSFDDITVQNAQDCDILSPCGIDNPVPIFLVSGKLTGVTALSGGKHTRLTVASDSGKTAGILWFGQKTSTVPFSVGDSISAAVTMMSGTYQGHSTVSLKCIDIHLDTLDYNELAAQAELFDNVVHGLVRVAPPSRDTAAAVYKALKSNSSCSLSDVELFLPLAAKGRNLTELMTAAEALRQSGLVCMRDGSYSLSKNQNKVDLYSTPIMKYLSKGGEKKP